MEHNTLPYTQNAEVALSSAYEYAKSCRLRYISADYLLLGLTSAVESTAFKILESHGVTYDSLIKYFYYKASPAILPAKLYYTDEACNVLQRSSEVATQYNSDRLDAEHILLAIVQGLNGIVLNAFIRLKVDIQALITELECTLYTNT